MGCSSRRCGWRRLGQKQLLAEVVALSQKGLAINNPNQKHQLRHYQGGSTVSALQAACIYYAGIQLLLPGQDAGIDLAREYALAQGMVGEQGETGEGLRSDPGGHGDVRPAER
jgi:hypothetical protein